MKKIKWLTVVLAALMIFTLLAACNGGTAGTTAAPATEPPAKTDPETQTEAPVVTDTETQTATQAETDEESGDTKESDESTSKKFKVGFSNVWVGNTWGVQCVNELESYLRNDDRVDEYFITDANNDINKQLSDIQDLISKDVDLLMLQPISPEAVTDLIEEAHDKGIIVVTCASPLATDKYHASVIAKDEDFGRIGMEWLAEKLNGEGNIIMLNGMAGITVSELRRNGAQSVPVSYTHLDVYKRQAEYGELILLDHGVKRATEQTL